MVALSLSIWAGFLFSVSRMPADAQGRHPGIDKLVGATGALHHVAYAVVSLPVPAAPLAAGLYLLSEHNRADDMWNSFVGERRSSGWWFFYPVGLFAKSPLGFLMLLGIGLAFIGRDRLRRLPDGWTALAAPLALIAILLVGLLSHVNTSIRHILQVYVPAAVIAGLGVWRAWAGGSWLRWIAAAGLAWHLISSAAAHPDYFAYLNEAGRQSPEWFGVGDLDYGQDLKRLADVCTRRGIDSLWISYHGTADMGLTGIREIRNLPPRERPAGWIAVSLMRLKLGSGDDPNAYAWLDQLQPVESVGKSIRLYYITGERSCPSRLN